MHRMIYSLQHHGKLDTSQLSGLILSAVQNCYHKKNRNEHFSIMSSMRLQLSVTTLLRYCITEFDILISDKSKTRKRTPSGPSEACDIYR